MARMHALLLLAALLSGASFSSALRANGSVQGFVFAQGTSQGLAGATIVVTGGCLGPYCSYYAYATSAADGAFAVADIPPGTYTVGAYYYPAAAGNYLPVSQPVGVSDAVATHVTLYMTPGATISGTVTRASDGAPVANLEVDLVVAGTVNDNVNGTLTDAAGAYQITQLAAGSYALRASVGNSVLPYQDQFYSGHPLTPPSQGAQAQDLLEVATGQDLANIDFVLADGGIVRGTLTDSYSGLPIANVANVSFVLYDPGDANNAPWLGSYASTDAQGHYELRGLPEAEFLLAAYAYSPYYNLSEVGCPDPCSDRSKGATLHAPDGTTLESIDLSLFPGSVITGSVTRRSDGTPIAGATVSAYMYFWGSPSLSAATTTDALGHYALTGPLQGHYIEVSGAIDGSGAYIGQDYNDHDCQQGACATLSGDAVPAPLFQVTTSIDFKLDHGGAIRGRVVSKQDMQQGLQGYVRLYAADGSPTKLVATHPDGYYSTDGLQAGSYFLEASVVGECLAYPDVPCASMTDITTDSQAVVVTGPEDVSGIDFVMDDGVFASSFE